MAYCLEMRSTADWEDVRYREYTTSIRKVELFRRVPKIKFTDSGHHIIPVVTEHSGKRLPRNMALHNHVFAAMADLVNQPRRPPLPHDEQGGNQ